MCMDGKNPEIAKGIETAFAPVGGAFVDGLTGRGSPEAAGIGIRYPGYCAAVGEVGGAEGNRTPDLRDANATLSRLSYGPNGRVL